MTPRTFWTLFLRAFGLYLIWQTLTIAPSVFSALMYFGSSPDKSGLFTMISAIVFIVLFFIAFLRACIFKTEWIIDKLHLANNMPDEKIDINIHRSSLLSIAVIVLGGVMLADSLPMLLFNIFQYLQHSENSVTFTQNNSSPYLISNLVKVAIGYFMVADSRLIVNIIERKRKKTQIVAEEENTD